LAEGESGFDNYGQSVTFRDIFWYALGSFQLGKNTVDSNSYFCYLESTSEATWQDKLISAIEKQRAA